MDEELIKAASELSEILLTRGWIVTTAESCTSGWVGAALAAASDSSRFYSSGFITYTNQAKHRILGVSNGTLERDTAVSESAVSEMAAGAKKLSGDDISIAISGYAGPEGGEDGTPAGTVWFAWCLQDNHIHTCRKHFAGDSEEVVRQAALYSLNELNRLLRQSTSL